MNTGSLSLSWSLTKYRQNTEEEQRPQTADLKLGKIRVEFSCNHSASAPVSSLRFDNQEEGFFIKIAT